jgi:IMP dehydrogenase
LENVVAEIRRDMNEAITFNDVLIKPKFSRIESRKDVDLSVKRLGLDLKLPVVSANMDTITNSNMAIAMGEYGAVGCLHRFQSVEDNVKELKSVLQHAGQQVMCSIGLGPSELERAEALVDAGCVSLVLDLAHGAQLSVVKQVRELRELLGYDFSLVVGNFATGQGVRDFLGYMKAESIQGVKAGIGCGSRCLTRVVTGVGQPQLSTIMEISNELRYNNLTIIADGGMDSVGDIAKALGAGAHLVMSGSFFAGCEESPGETQYLHSSGKAYSFENFPVNVEYYIGWSEEQRKEFSDNIPKVKKYRGSASRESYEAQGKVAKHRATEGDATLIPYKGPVADVLQEIEGGLRSSLTYTGSRTLEEFHRNVEFVRVSSNTVVENGTRNGVK